MRFTRIFRIQRGEGRLVALVVGMMFAASAALTNPMVLLRRLVEVAIFARTSSADCGGRVP